jgi:hypothetical protein
MKYNHPQEAFLAKADEKFITTLEEQQEKPVPHSSHFEVN